MKWSQMNVVSNECGLKWLWSQMNVVSNEYGLKWLWSQMNLVSDECGPKWMVSNELVSIVMEPSQSASAGRRTNCTLVLSVSGASRSRLCPRPVTKRGESPTRKLFFSPLEKCVGHSLKNLGPSEKTLRPTWCPKLVTGLLCPDGPCVHLSGPAYMPGCIRPQVRLPLDQYILCGDCCKKIKATV